MRGLFGESPGEIRFHFARGLSYGRRLALASGLLAAGLLVQVWLLGWGPWWIGVPLLCVGTSLLWSRGYSTVVEVEGKRRDWRPATRAEVERIIELDRRQKRWDQSALDITCPTGVLALVCVVLAVGIWVLATPPGPSRTFIGLNAAVVLLPFWVTGVRSILRNDALVVKCGILLRLERRLEASATGGGLGARFQHQIQTAEAKNEVGEVPVDVKGVVTFPEGAEGFLGVQLQVAINDVEGTSYPYFYAVLVARRRFRAMRADRLGAPPKNVILEESRDGDVEIVVVRQRTTSRSGYHTATRAVWAIFDYAVGEARRLLPRRGATEPREGARGEHGEGL